MGIFGAMAKAAGKEIKKSVNRKLKQASGRPVRAATYTPPEKKATGRKRKKKLPASSVTRRKR